MNEVVKNVLKNGLIMLAVGAALALAAPEIAQVLGQEVLGSQAFAQAMSTPIIWTGVFFGAFGAIHAAIAPAAAWIFGPEKKDSAEAVTVEKEKSCSKCQGHAPDIAQPVHNKKYLLILENKRAADSSQQIQR
jgi:hypothetical protein